MVSKSVQQRRFYTTFSVGDEAAFVKNGNVNIRNIIEYAPKGQHAAFHYNKSVTREKLVVWIKLWGNGNLGV